MFYAPLGDRFIQSGSIAGILKQLPFIPSFNHRYLTNYFLNSYFASRDNLFETLFMGIYRVPIGYQLKIKNNQATVERSWSFKDPSPSSVLPFKETVSIFQQKLQAATQAALPVNQRVAIELSGGLDSSTVAALTRMCLPHSSILALTHAVPKTLPNWLNQLSDEEKKICKRAAYDESPWSQSVAEHLQLNQHWVGDTYHFHDIIEHYTEVLGCFCEVIFPLLNHCDYEICQQHGISTLLSGFGGDEVVSQYATLYLQELRNEKAYFKFFYEKFRGKTLHDWLQSLRLIQATPSAWRKPSTHLEYLCLDTSTHNCYALPIHTHVQAREYDFIEGNLSLHWQRRIETCQIIAKSYGIDYQFPLAHPDLMCFFHHLPAGYKRRHGTGRYLLRCSMESYLPKKVVWRRDKAGGTSPLAWFNLLNVLPELFLSRITPDYSGALLDYINIKKLIRRVETGPTLDDHLIRLIITVLMFAHLEKYLSALPNIN